MRGWTNALSSSSSKESQNHHRIRIGTEKTDTRGEKEKSERENDRPSDPPGRLTSTLVGNLHQPQTQAVESGKSIAPITRLHGWIDNGHTRIQTWIFRRFVMQGQGRDRAPGASDLLDAEEWRGEQTVLPSDDVDDDRGNAVAADDCLIPACSSCQTRRSSIVWQWGCPVDGPTGLNLGLSLVGLGGVGV
ncbi:uncharacterized protein BO72DRAFT_155246 [Aspergillus fijiensis CBS 313.89]|uniref:Uncharacterized protein n=1 Tax=Aspergillus fijiensis CBS 313.89 TaxID=1448319 RepID=A0A8G1RQU1_9EURO|nr:uncharacterized protein BO72DRAFT_155246 [Aspergillus fijiensis CBS 313.89]RAK75851.1 hypothetical protein BO72DRAFT_155246 [Aspergillus fijiensis CBS 313.89]